MKLMIRRKSGETIQGLRKATFLPQFIYYPERIIVETVRTVREHSGLGEFQGDMWRLAWRLPLILKFYIEISRLIREHRMPTTTWRLVYGLLMLILLRSFIGQATSEKQMNE